MECQKKSRNLRTIFHLHSIYGEKRLGLKREELIPETLIPDPKESATAAGLRYVSDESPGIIRKRRGDGFVFFDVEGRRVKGTAELHRIRSLAIPPAWEN